MSRLHSRPEFDLSFRPRTYWAHDDAVSAITANIKGTLRKQMVEDVLSAEGVERDFYDASIGSLDSSLLEPDAGPELKTVLGMIHPGWMGGEYLPDYLRGEVEIARVELQSVTADVYSVRARRTTTSSRIHYRIVDEYPEEGVWTLSVKSSALPLTFRKLLKLIDTSKSALTWDIPEDGNLTDGLRSSDESQDGDAYRAAEFVTVRSSFYPRLSAYYQKKAEVWLENWLRENRQEDEDEEQNTDAESDSAEFGSP